MLEADEPTKRLDSNTGAAIEETLFRLSKEKGILLFINTPDKD